METPEFIEKMDWSLLDQQKTTLLDIMQKRCFTPKDQAHLEGILHTIDAIQDYVVDTVGISSKEVFGYEPSRQGNSLRYRDDGGTD